MLKQNEEMHWFEWSSKVLQKAKDENKPIFIYISYESCKLCNQMENEVFNQKECYELLNEKFISILVDKDKKADIDKYFQKAHHIINKSYGGWPLCIFATPEVKPFFVKTYMSLDSKSGAIEDIGIIELANIIYEKISTKDASTLKNADEIEQFLKKIQHPSQATKLSPEFVKNYMHQIKNNYKKEFGGFCDVPKFPQANTLNTLIYIDRLYNDSDAKTMLRTTLDNMSASCIKNNGFSRYFLSDDWESVSDDKTVYDNALLCQTYIDAYKLYKYDRYLDTAKVCAQFCIQNKTDITVQKAMYINALFSLTSVDESYLKTALKELDVILSVDNINTLEEFAFIASALIEAYKCTSEQHYLIKATQFANKSLERFYNFGGWLFCDNEFKTKADISDNIYTSGVSVMVDVLLDIASLLKDEKYAHYAYKTLEYNSYELARNSVYYPSMLRVMLKYLKERNNGN
jgi:uncharacterized protein YyaL (SSP411 family)